MFVSTVITLSILLLLVITGPAQAFILELTIPDKDVSKGEIVNFIASTTIESDEILDISHFLLELSGPEIIKCSFSPDGKIIEGCKGITIERISVPSGSYGYIFPKGNLSFNITLDTNEFDIGVYKPNLFIVIKQLTFKQIGDKLIIRGVVEQNSSCSIRSDNGNIRVNNTLFDRNNNINFHIPEQGISRGMGSLTSQTGRKRLSYAFNAKSVLENNNNRLVVSVDGSYKINRDKPIKEEAIFMINKKTKKIDIIGDNIRASNMNVSLLAGCGPITKIK